MLIKILLFDFRLKKISIYMRSLFTILVFFLFTTLISETSAQSNNKITSKIEASFENLIDTYIFFNDYNRTIKILDSISTICCKHKLWHLYLKSANSKTYAALQHKQIDQAVEFLQKCDYILNQYKKQIEILDTNYINRCELIKVHGVYYFNVGNLNMAQEQFNKIFPDGKNPLTNDGVFIASIYAYMAMINSILGFYDKAFINYRKILDYLPKSEKWYNYYNTLYTQYIGRYYFSVKDYDNSLFYYHKALSELKKHKIETIWKASKVNCYLSIASIYYKQDKYSSAIESLKKVNFITKDDPLYNDIMEMYAELYIHFKMYEKAIESYNVMLEIYSNLFKGKHYEKATILSEIGTIYKIKGDFQKASQYYCLAADQLNINSVSFINADLEDLTKPTFFTNELLDIIINQAENYYLWYRLNYNDPNKNIKCIKYYKIATLIIDRLRNELSSMQIKNFYSEKYNSVYEKVLDATFIACQKKQIKNAADVFFYFIEKSKSQQLYDAVKNSSAKKYAGIPDFYIEKENKLKEMISFLKSEYHKQKENINKEESERIETKILAKENEYLLLIKTFEKKFPKYFNLKYNTSLPDLHSVQQVYLNRSTSIIEYFYGDSSVYAIIIDKKRIQIRKITDINKINKLLDDLHSCLDNQNIYEFENSKIKYNQFINASSKLYKLLLKTTNKSCKRLIIIPDGKLGYLPFDVLLTKFSNSKNVNYEDLSYLLYDISVIYEYSVAMLCDKSFYSTEKNKKVNYIGFAPKFVKKLGLSGHIRKTERINNLKGLIYNSKEIDLSAKLFDGDKYMGDMATEENFKTYGKHKKIIHLATHTYIDNDDPSFSGLVFSNPFPENKEQSEDNFLFLHELYNLELGSEIAILSACETGTGMFIEGEGIMSLARAFKFAGCPNVVMSLWKANDKTTCNIMYSFCYFLHKNYKKDNALRNAKIWYLKKSEKKHPFYWSGFVIIGNSSSLDQNIYSKILFVAVLFILIFFAVIVILKKGLKITSS